MPVIAVHELCETDDDTAIYNGIDCLATSGSFLNMKPLEPQCGPIYSFEKALQGPVLDMMLRGFRVDPATRDKGLRRCYRELAHLDHIIQSIANAVWDKDINPNSGDQLKDFFYNHLAITPVSKWVQGNTKYPMDRAVLEKLSNYYYAQLICNSILAHRDLTKQVQVLETEVDDDWRMRTSYNIGGTNEGRFSSSKSATGSGGNLQNVTESLRHIFIADPGYKIIGIDVSQSDSRFIGFRCGQLFNDWTYLNACESGDLHTSVAMTVWPNLPWTRDLKKNKKIAEEVFYRHFSYRDACKRLGHGINFLGKDQTMSQETRIPKPLVGNFRVSYFDAFPCLVKWQQYIAQEIQTKKQLTSVFGRTRDFFGRVESDDILRKALAFDAASPTADNLNLAMWRIWKYMPHVQLLAQLHDAVYFQYEEKRYKEQDIVNEAISYFKIELKANGRTFSAPCEAKSGYNWGNRCKKDEDGKDIEINPKGLDKIGALR